MRKYFFNLVLLFSLISIGCKDSKQSSPESNDTAVENAELKNEGAEGATKIGENQNKDSKQLKRANPVKAEKLNLTQKRDSLRQNISQEEKALQQRAKQQKKDGRSLEERTTAEQKRLKKAKKKSENLYTKEFWDSVTTTLKISKEKATKLKTLIEERELATQNPNYAADAEVNKSHNQKIKSLLGDEDYHGYRIFVREWKKGTKKTK